jgi:hypothetical protein
LRLGEIRRLNGKARFSQRRKDAKAPPFISQRPSGVTQSAVSLVSERRSRYKKAQYNFP